MRREHPKWGPLRLAHELARAGVVPAPSRMSVYRVLVRHGLVEPGPRKRPKDSYLRWERDEPMALWQLDIVGGAFLAGGTEAKVVTGVDDHSRYCVIASVVPGGPSAWRSLPRCALTGRRQAPDHRTQDQQLTPDRRAPQAGGALLSRLLSFTRRVCTWPPWFLQVRCSALGLSVSVSGEGWALGSITVAPRPSRPMNARTIMAIP
jgi:hypothetical protein